MVILLISIASACTNITTADLTNSSLHLNQGDCYLITDINSTLNVTDYRIDGTINMTPYQVTTNPTTNTQYVCRYDLLNVSQTLPFSGSYTNAEHNISIIAPAFPPMNLEINVTAGDNYVNSTYNLTVHALYRKVNINDTLDFLECYNDTNTNLSLCAPPKMNVYENLSYGLSFINSTYNVTINAPPYPNINEHRSLGCGETWNWTQVGISATAPPCAGVTRTMGFGERYQDSNYKIDLTVIAKPNITLTLSSGQNYTSDMYGVSATCEATRDQFIDFCKNFSDENITQYWEAVNISNYTCNNFAFTCIDNISSHCTSEEKFGGPLRLLECNNRILEQTTIKCKEDADSLAICTSEKEALSRAPQAISDTKNDIVNFFITGLMVIIILGCGFFLFARYLEKKKIEGGEGQVE